MKEQYKGGPGLHPPRCICPDCQSAFVNHNRLFHCNCMSCVYHREIGAPSPPVMQEPSTQSSYTTYNPPTVNNQPDRRKKVAGINICERDGCDALVRGTALSYVDIMPNTVPGTEREVIELCPACMEEIYKFIKGPAVGHRDRGYSKPFEPGKEASDDVESATDEHLLAALLTRLAKRGNKELKATAYDSTVDSD